MKPVGALGTIVSSLEAELLQRDALPPRKRHLIRLGVLAAVDAGDERLQAAFRDARGTGLSPETLDDLVIHCAAYVGFVRAEALQASLRQALSPAEADTVAGGSDSVSSQPAVVRAAKGFDLYARLDRVRAGEQRAFFDALSPDHYGGVMAIFACTFDRPALTLQERELVTVAMLCALGTAERQLEFHARVALEVGCGRTELVEALLHVQLYAGLPAANNAAMAVRRALVA